MSTISSWKKSRTYKLGSVFWLSEDMDDRISLGKRIVEKENYPGDNTGPIEEWPVRLDSINWIAKVAQIKPKVIISPAVIFLVKRGFTALDFGSDLLHVAREYWRNQARNKGQIVVEIRKSSNSEGESVTLFFLGKGWTASVSCNLTCEYLNVYVYENSSEDVIDQIAEDARQAYASTGMLSPTVETYPDVDKVVSIGALGLKMRLIASIPF